MCLPFINKMFGGSKRNRRRNSSGLVPRPSLAITGQSSDGGMSSVPLPMNNIEASDTAASMIMMPTPMIMVNNNARDLQVSPEELGEATPATSVPQAERASTWWDLFGMNKNKKPSVDSL